MPTRTSSTALRDAVVEDLHTLHSAYPEFGKVTAADLDPNFYAGMREKYGRILYYGVFSLPGKRTLANELIWKWTEATGKYVGCQFWSIDAKAVFDREVESVGGWPLTISLARRLERKTEHQIPARFDQTDARACVSDQRRKAVARQ